MIDFFSSEFNLTHHSFIYACLSVGLLLALNRAFIGKNWLKGFGLTPLIEPITNFIKGNSQNGIEAYLFQLIGAGSLLLLSFLSSYLFLALFIALFKRKNGSGFIDIFADFWRGGYLAIDDRTKQLESEKSIAESELLQTHHGYSRLLSITKFYAPATPEKFSELTALLLDSAFSTVFGTQKKFRLAVYLCEADPSKNNKLTLTCSVHISKKTPDHISHEWSIPDSVAGKCYDTGEIFTHPSKQTKTAFKPSRNPKNSFTKSFACVRIQWEKKKWGVLSLDSDENSFPNLTEGQWLFLRSLCSLIGESLEKSNGCSKWKSVQVK